MSTDLREPETVVELPGALQRNRPLLVGLAVGLSAVLMLLGTREVQGWLKGPGEAVDHLGGLPGATSYPLTTSEVPAAAQERAAAILQADPLITRLRGDAAVTLGPVGIFDSGRRIIGVSSRVTFSHPVSAVDATVPVYDFCAGRLRDGRLTNAGISSLGVYILFKPGRVVSIDASVDPVPTSGALPGLVEPKLDSCPSSD